VHQIEEVRTVLCKDYSEDRQWDIADHFFVSPMVVNTLFKNSMVERDYTEYKPNIAVA
jgi:hypothetical protein